MGWSEDELRDVLPHASETFAAAARKALGDTPAPTVTAPPPTPAGGVRWLRFPQPDGGPISANHRLSWPTLRQHRLAWHTAADVAGRRFGSFAPATVVVEFTFPKRARRDPHNYVAPTTKWIVDALVSCGWWPDDTPEWVSVAEPRLVVSWSNTCTVRVKERRT